jgi:hypothetical protein
MGKRTGFTNFRSGVTLGGRSKKEVEKGIKTSKTELTGVGYYEMPTTGTFSSAR